jgi:hypothetical protein
MDAQTRFTNPTLLATVPAYEAQNSIGHKFVELSVDAARRLWKIDESRAA